MITHDAPYIDRRILLEAKCLSENGYEVDIVYPFGEINDDFISDKIMYLPLMIVSADKAVSLKSVVKKFAPKFMFNGLKKIYIFFKKVESSNSEQAFLSKVLECEYDIFMAHDLPALPIAHEAAKKQSAKLVYDAHEFFIGQSVIPKKELICLEQMETKLIKDVDLMFTVNKDIVNLFTEKYSISNIETLYNAIEEQKENKVNNLHQLLDIEKEKKIVLLQGGFIEGRNLELLVESGQFLPDNIVLVMLGYAYLEEKLKQIAKRTGAFGKKVIFMDRGPQKELLSYSAGADFGIIPYPDVDLNTKYCTPNKMFEFLTANVPIIANERLVTVSDIINEHKIGVTIAFESAKTIAEGIERSVKQMNVDEIKVNMKEALKTLSWEEQEIRLLEAFNRLEK
jgi:hypothetical protein